MCRTAGRLGQNNGWKEKAPILFVSLQSLTWLVIKGLPFLVASLIPICECARQATMGVLVPVSLGSGLHVNVNAKRWAVSAVMAAHHVNQRVTSLVPQAERLVPSGFNVSLDIVDSKAHPASAVQQVWEWAGQTIHVIIGADSTAVTGPVAVAASMDNTPVITCGSTTSALQGRSVFPTLSRTVVADTIVADGTIRSLWAMGWRRIAMVIVDDEWGNRVWQIVCRGGDASRESCRRRGGGVNELRDGRRIADLQIGGGRGGI
eukprot:1029975-Rhodomonas_salina.1